MATSTLKDIGNVLSMRETIDPGLRVTKYIRSYLGVVDIVPIDYVLKLNVLNKKNGGWAVEYDYENGISKYKKILGNYKLDPYSGLRLWLTDDSQAYDEISQHFDNNIIEEGLNTLTGKARSFSALFQSGKSTDLLNTISKDAEQLLRTKAADLARSSGAVIAGIGGYDQDMQTKIEEMVAGATGTAADIIFEGKQISLPRIWKGSNYNPTLNLNIKLISPYGHKTAIKHYIINPLLYILLLAVPRSSDGLSYGQFQPIKLKGYGMSNINLGAIVNVSIRRGGKETVYNVWKQPLILEVALTIRPLADGFACMDETPDIANFDHADQDYNENAGGAPIITTVGNMIQSLRPAPRSVVEQNTPGGGFSSFSNTGNLRPVQSNPQPIVNRNTTPTTNEWFGR